MLLKKSKLDLHPNLTCSLRNPDPVPTQPMNRDRREDLRRSTLHHRSVPFVLIISFEGKIKTSTLLLHTRHTVTYPIHSLVKAIIKRDHGWWSNFSSPFFFVVCGYISFFQFDDPCGSCSVMWRICRGCIFSSPSSSSCPFYDIHWTCPVALVLNFVDD